MDKNLDKILSIDQEIGDFLYDNDSLSDKEISTKFEEHRFIDRAIKIINKLSNKSIIELLKRSRYLRDYIDMKRFIKKYPINKKRLKDNKELYLEEYQKLQKTCLFLNDISIDTQEFLEYLDILDVENIEKYLLKNMSNEQIYSLANSTNIWEEKLYFFSFLKKNKRGKTVN